MWGRKRFDLLYFFTHFCERENRVLVVTSPLRAGFKSQRPHQQNLQALIVVYLFLLPCICVNLENRTPNFWVKGRRLKTALELALAQISSSEDIASFLKNYLLDFKPKKSRSEYVELHFEDVFANQGNGLSLNDLLFQAKISCSHC